MSNFSIGYNFQPNDIVWVVDPVAQSVHRGTCVQVDIKIVPDSAFNPLPTILYWVVQDGNVGSVKVTESNIFATLEEALAALSVDITPTPTPTPSPTTTLTATPTQTPTPSTPAPTPSSTPAVTPTPTSTTTTTPTPTVSPT